MRHKKLNKRFGRNNAQRKELMRSLVRALFISYRIQTTLAKAKEARRQAEGLLVRAKGGTLSDIRLIDRVIQDRALTKKLVQQIAPLFKERKSGFTRIIRTVFRRGDGAPMAILELTEMPAIEKKPKRQKQAQDLKAEKKRELHAHDEPVETTAVEDTEKKEIPPKPPEPKKIPRDEERPQPPEKKETPEPKTTRPPKEGKPAGDKKWLFGKLKGFFKKEK